MRPLLWALALVPALIALGALLGWLQLAWYRLRGRKPEDIPFFGALLLRGLAFAVAALAALAIASHIASGTAS